MTAATVKAGLAIAGIFVAGAIAGGLGHAAWQRHRAERLSAQQIADRQLRWLIHDLELSADQIDCIRPLVYDFADQLRVARRHAFAEVGAVLREMNLRIEKELSPEQLQKFRKIQERQRQRWERETNRRSHREAKPDRDRDRNRDGEDSSHADGDGSGSSAKPSEAKPESLPR